MIKIRKGVMVNPRFVVSISTIENTSGDELEGEVIIVDIIGNEHKEYFKTFAEAEVRAKNLEVSVDAANA